MTKQLTVIQQLQELPNFVIIPSTPENGSRYTKEQKPDKQIIHAHGEFINMDGDHEPDYYAKQWQDKLNYAPHFFITPSGVIMMLLNPDIMGAHALKNNWQTVGIEYMVAGAHNYYTFLEAIKKPYLTEAQYEAGVLLSAILHNAGAVKLARHSDVDPTRKKDPGEGFPWKKFNEDVKKKIQEL